MDRIIASLATRAHGIVTRVALLRAGVSRREIQRRLERGSLSKRSRIEPADAAVCRAIPVTSVARTLVDLAAVLTADELARAFHEANVRYRTTPADIEAVLVRRPNTPTHKLPLPKTNRPAGGRFVDCRWPEHKLTVELDSYAFHNSRHSWEQDRKREREAYRRGDQFRRYTWADVTENPRPMLGELRGLLGR